MMSVTKSKYKFTFDFSMSVGISLYIVALEPFKVIISWRTSSLVTFCTFCAMIVLTTFKKAFKISKGSTWSLAVFFSPRSIMILIKKWFNRFARTFSFETRSPLSTRRSLLRYIFLLLKNGLIVPQNFMWLEISQMFKFPIYTLYLFFPIKFAQKFILFVVDSVLLCSFFVVNAFNLNLIKNAFIKFLFKKGLLLLLYLNIFFFSGACLFKTLVNKFGNMNNQLFEPLLVCYMYLAWMFLYQIFWYHGNALFLNHLWWIHS